MDSACCIVEIYVGDIVHDMLTGVFIEVCVIGKCRNLKVLSTGHVEEVEAEMLKNAVWCPVMFHSNMLKEYSIQRNASMRFLFSPSWCDRCFQCIELTYFSYQSIRLVSSENSSSSSSLYAWDDLQHHQLSVRFSISSR